MDSHQYEALRKHFNDRRLHPWLPEHALFIKGELAKLEVTDAAAALSYTAFYEQKMATYMAEHPEEFPVEAPVQPEVTVEVLPEEVQPKKRGRKPKIS